MLDGRVRASASRRAAPWIFAVAVAIMPFAASAQSEVSGKPAVTTVAAPKSVDLSAVPQISASALREMAARAQPLHPRHAVTDQQFAALKAAAAGRRFDMPNVEPSPPPTNPAAGSTAEGVLTPGLPQEAEAYRSARVRMDYESRRLLDADRADR